MTSTLTRPVFTAYDIEEIPMRRIGRDRRLPRRATRGSRANQRCYVVDQSARYDR